MSDLDKKLEAAYGYEFKPTIGGTKFETKVDLEAIKQAFIDDGWVKSKSTHFTRYANEAEKVMTKEEWERQAVKDGWRRCIDPNDHAHWLETDTVSSNIRPDFVGPDAVLPHSNLSDEQLDAISEEWSKPRMTGQEWYDRFEKEYKAIAPIFRFDHKAYIAAKKASGVE